MLPAPVPEPPAPPPGASTTIRLCTLAIGLAYVGHSYMITGSLPHHPLNFFAFIAFAACVRNTHNAYENLECFNILYMVYTHTMSVVLCALLVHSTFISPDTYFEEYFRLFGYIGMACFTSWAWYIIKIALESTRPNDGDD